MKISLYIFEFDFSKLSKTLLLLASFHKIAFLVGAPLELIGQTPTIFPVIPTEVIFLDLIFDFFMVSFMSLEVIFQNKLILISDLPKLSETTGFLDECLNLILKFLSKITTLIILVPASMHK